MRLFCLILLAALFFACGEKTPLFSQNQSENLAEKPLSYREQLVNIGKERALLTSQYQKKPQNRENLEKARQIFIRSAYRDIIPFWYETQWDFYGTTETPKEGKIACGYFVTTVLRDAGLRVERARLAQQASEKIIQSLTKEAYIKRFRRVKIEDFVEAIEKWGEGFYIVGLDFHVGFIVNDGEKVYFIHSSYAEPYQVIKEIAVDSKVLAGSNYRVVGKISADNELLTKWLLQKNIPTKR